MSLLPPGDSQSGHPDDQLASYVLGLLDAEAAAEVEAHVSGCIVCTDEVSHLQVAVDGLALAVGPVAPPAASRDRLLARVVEDRRQGASEPAHPIAIPALVASQPVMAAPFWLYPRPMAWISLAASLLVAVVSSWQLVMARREMVSLRQEIAALEASREPVLALAQLDAGAQTVTLRGGPGAPSASGKVFYAPGGRKAVVLLERLPSLEPGRVFQVWLLGPPPAAPVSAGTLAVHGDGVGTLVVDAPVDLSRLAGFGITIEPVPGQPQPTGPMVASGML